MSISIKFVFYVHYFRQMAIFHVTLVQIYLLTKHFKCFVLKGGLTKSYVISCPVENITFLKLISSSAQFIVSAKRSKIFKIGKCLLVQAFKIPQNMYRALVKIPAPCAQKKLKKGMAKIHKMCARSHHYFHETMRRKYC